VFLAENCKRTISAHADHKASVISLLQNIIEAKISHDLKQDQTFVRKAEKFRVIP